jgi:hypothetical protein
LRCSGDTVGFAPGHLESAHTHLALAAPIAADDPAYRLAVYGVTGRLDEARLAFAGAALRPAAFLAGFFAVLRRAAPFVKRRRDSVQKVLQIGVNANS